MKKALIAAFASLAAVAAQAETVGRTIYMDFGEVTPSRGGTTEGADSNGHYWTNIKTSSNNYTYPGTVYQLVDSENNPTGYDLLVNTRFMSNGTTAAGGLVKPKAEYLGDLAVESATYDYILRLYIRGDISGFQLLYIPQSRPA